MRCPNINSPEWKNLVAKIGTFEAMRAYIRNGEEIPDVNTVETDSIEQETDIQFNRPVTYQEQLDQFTQRWSLKLTKKDGVVGYPATTKVVKEMSKQMENKSGYLYEKLEFGFSPVTGMLRIQPKELEDMLQMNRMEQEATMAREIFDKTIAPLADKLGVKYQVVTAEEAVEITKESKNVKYNGETAFYYNGIAYVLDTAISLINGIHEVIHPFIDAVAASNPALFAKLYKDLVTTNTGAKILRDVSQAYSEFSEIGQQKEIIVRGLTALAKNNIEAGEEKQIRGIFSKLWFQIKQLFRKYFGAAVKVSEINENTSLQEIADMLTGDTFKIETKVVTDENMLQFSKLHKELFVDIEQLSNEDLDKTINNYFDIVQSHIGKILKNPSYEELMKITTAETGRNKLATFQQMLDQAKKLGSEAEDVKKKVSNLTHVIGETKVITEKILDRLREISKEPITQDTIQQMSYFKSVLTDWEQFYENLTDDITLPSATNSALFANINTTKGNISTALKQINKNNMPGLLEVLGDMLGSVKESLDEDHKQRLALYQKQKDEGNQSAQNFINAENERYKRFDLSKENLLAYIQGKHGDTNTFSGFFEAAISSPDPIIGGFAKFIKTNLYVIQAKVRNIDVDMRNDLNPLYKAAGINRNNVAQLGSQITFLDDRLKFVDGKPVKSQVVTLMNQFKNYQHDIAILNHEIKVADEAGNEVEVKQKKRDLDKLERTYMHRPYIDAYYELQDIWNTPNGEIAKKKRQDIFEFIQHLEDTGGTLPDEVEETLLAIEDKWKEYAQLGSLTDLNGDPKTLEDLEVAKVIKEYNEKSRPFYNWNEKEGLFEDRYTQFKQSLEDNGINEGSEEYDDEVQKWQDKNLKKSLDESFYSDRQVLLDQIKEILAKVPQDMQNDVAVSDLWGDIIELTHGFRDDDGQPVGSDMTEAKIEKIKAIQENIILAQQKLTKISGLSSNDQERLNDLFAVKREGNIYTPEQKVEMTKLLAKKGEIKKHISAIEFTTLFNLFDQLRDLQSKVPTNYYLDIMNNYLGKLNSPAITADNAVEMLDDHVLLSSLFSQDPQFAVWFQKNHILKEKWDAEEEEMVPYYERIYVWNKITPNDPKYYKTYTLSTGETLRGTPNSEYYKREVKDEFKTGYNKTTKKVELIVGVHVSNKSDTDFLPKTATDAAGKNGWDSKYINERYDKLKTSNPNVFNILGVMSKYHLNSQEGAEYGNKLWMDVPRFRKQELEYLQSGKAKGDVTNKLQSIGKGIKSIVTKQSDDFNQGIGNFNSEMEDRFVHTDIFNNEMVKIPIKGMAMLDVDQVSLDIGGSIMRHIESLETNKQLIKMNPIAEALLDTLEDNGVKKINTISQKLFRNKGLKTLANDTKNNRHQILKNLHERIFQGMENQMEIGAGWNKAGNQLMKLSAFGSLMLSAPGSIKNMFAAQVQGAIEGMGGKHITINEYRKGLNRMTIKFAPAMISDYNKFADHSYETQLMRMFDFIQGKTEDKFGDEYTSANSKNLISGKFGFFGLALGEMESQGGFGLGLLMHQKIKQTLPTGEVKEIEYVDAFEKVDGKIKLKEGIDPEWGEGGKKFNQFKLLAHELSQKLQGNYAKIDQPEMQRYTTLRLFSFMRRYFVPAFTNRMSTDRIQTGVNGSREGYYMTTLRMFKNTFRDHKVNWGLYTPDEKKNFFKTLTEVGVSIMFYLLLRSLGWDNDDKEKLKKLKDNSWATNHLIYQLMAIKSESEQFIPVPGMGLDELMRIKNTPSIAFGHMDKWYKLLTDVTSPLEETDQKSGFWDKGTNKIFIDMTKIAGFTGGTLNPELAVKNFSLMQSRTN